MAVITWTMLCFVRTGVTGKVPSKERRASHAFSV